MTDHIKKFDGATQAADAFKITAQALIDQGEAVVSEHDPAGDTPYKILSDISRTVPFSAIAESFGDMLETVPSPLAERIAVLAAERAQAYGNTGEQVVNQLYLADVSARVPHFGPELPDAAAIHEEVVDFLNLHHPAQLAAIHEQATPFLANLSHDTKVILAENIYDAVARLSALETPSPLVAERLYGVMLTNIDAPQVDDKYGAAVDKLFDITTVEAQLAILAEKIDAVTGMAEADSMIATDPVLSRFGKTEQDFLYEDGSKKHADCFIQRPVKGLGAEPAPAQK